MVYAFEINPTNFAPAIFSNLGSILNLIIPLLLAGAGLLFMVMFIFAGFQYISGGGNAEKLKKATDNLKNSAFGLVIIIISYFLVKLISSVLNINTPL